MIFHIPLIFCCFLPSSVLAACHAASLNAPQVARVLPVAEPSKIVLTNHSQNDARRFTSNWMPIFTVAVG